MSLGPQHTVEMKTPQCSVLGISLIVTFLFLNHNGDVLLQKSIVICDIEVQSASLCKSVSKTANGKVTALL